MGAAPWEEDKGEGEVEGEAEGEAEGRLTHQGRKEQSNRVSSLKVHSLLQVSCFYHRVVTMVTEQLKNMPSHHPDFVCLQDTKVNVGVGDFIIP